MERLAANYASCVSAAAPRIQVSSSLIMTENLHCGVWLPKGYNYFLHDIQYLK